MREALADALSDFDGALVLVSHDRHLLGLVCDSFWRVADGVVESFDGDLDDYAAWLRTRGTAKKISKVARAQKAAAPSRDMSPDERRRVAAGQRDSDKAARQRVKHIETRTTKIDAELVTLETRLADPQAWSGPTQELLLCSQRQAELRREKDALETEWLQLVDQLEA
jgi:ATP-binding cassette subfamily F protein 3